MSITTIIIGANSYTSYATVVEADAFLAVDPVRSATWNALTPDQKGTNLVASTRRLDALCWQGTKVGGAAQQNAWPRNDVFYPDGTPVTNSDVPQEVEDACILLAGTVALDATASQVTVGSPKAKTIKAGSSSITYFSSAAAAGLLLPDQTALSLITIFMASCPEAFSSNEYSGGDADSTFEDGDRWNRTEGYP